MTCGVRAHAPPYAGPLVPPAHASNIPDGNVFGGPFAAAAEGAILASFRMGDLKSPLSTPRNDIKSVGPLFRDREDMARNIKRFRRGALGAEAQNYARWLAERPANLMLPEDFARHAQSVCQVRLDWCTGAGRLVSRDAPARPCGARVGGSCWRATPRSKSAWAPARRSCARRRWRPLPPSPKVGAAVPRRPRRRARVAPYRRRGRVDFAWRTRQGRRGRRCCWRSPTRAAPRRSRRSASWARASPLTGPLASSARRLDDAAAPSS